MGDALSGACCQRSSVTTASIRRRAAAPLGLFAAIALAAGGGSAPLGINRPPGLQAARPAAPAAVHLEHLELVALRAQSTPAGSTR